MEPWRDPHHQTYPYGGVVRSAVQVTMQQRSDAAAAAAGGVLKRSLGDMERWRKQQQQQRQLALQQQLFMRTVRQRTAAASAAVSPLTSADIAAVLGGPPSQPLVLSGSSMGGTLGSPSSTLSSLTTASRAMAMPLTQPQLHLQRQHVTYTPSPQVQVLGTARALAPPAAASDMSILQELEKQLLGDDDEVEAAMSGTRSPVTGSEWEEQLNSITTAPSPPLPAAMTPNNNNNNAVGMTRSPSNSSTSTASSSASCSPPTSATTSRQLLSEAATAIADGHLETAATHLAALKRAANSRGDVEQRLVAMMVPALSSRIVQTASVPSQHVPDLCGAEQRTGSQLLHDISPCFRLGLQAANLAIVDAIGDHRAIHLVDFDVSAPQHADLIRCLAARRLPGTSLKVTAVTDPSSPFTQSLKTTLPAAGEQLQKIAERAGIDYRFKMVSCRAAEIEASKLGCEAGEALAVNLAFALSHVPDESVSPANPRDEILRRVRALGPQVVALVEQELNSNTAPLTTRFADACAHYGAILESLDVTFPRESAERARAEAALAGRAANAVGREGPERLERGGGFGKGRARVGMAGVRPVALGPGIADQVLARQGPVVAGFAVKAENGVLRLGWMGRVVTVASAWR
uniref:Uncharacterized protein n=1 Tax=Oryza brachyantha TaxID=4533 RepID=J3M0N7_ORYBR